MPQLQSLNYKLLDKKYIDKLGLDKINLISCYYKEQKDILSLSDKKLDVLVKCIDYYSKSLNAEDWTTIASRILGKICSNEYDELIHHTALFYNTRTKLNNAITLHDRMLDEICNVRR